jgi:hypothetical protein
MKDKIIYLDHNTAIDVMNKRDTSFVHSVDRARSLGAKFVYSPAHIEEVANILRQESLTDEQCDKYTRDHLDFFSKLTQNWEFLPGGSGPAILKQEHPAVCYKRVIDRYELTWIAEDVESVLRDLVAETSVLEVPLNAFDLPKVSNLLGLKLSLRGFECLPQGRELRDSHDVATQVVDICFRSLAEAGYGREPKSKTRSAIHDVTHSIYGLGADIFVSKDRKMLAKAKASYRILKAESVPMSPSEFTAHLGQFWE